MRNITGNPCVLSVLICSALLLVSVIAQRSDETDLDSVIAGILGSESSGDATTTEQSTTVEESTNAVQVGFYCVAIAIIDSPHPKYTTQN